MQCRNCGTEIADKALICYRCGTSTTVAKYKPHASPPTGSRATLVITAVVIALLVLLGLFLLNS